PAWHPYGRVVDPAGAGWIGVAKTRADNGETRVAKISDAGAASRDVAPRGPGRWFRGRHPRASRRRGLGEDSTAGTGAARRFCDTPREYQFRPVQGAPGRPPDGARPV